MKNLKLLVLAVITIASIEMIGCKKGDTGPVGATGPDSVMYSAPITLKMAYTQDSVGNWAYRDTIAASALTATALTQDIIEGYIYYPTGQGDSAWTNVNNNDWWYGIVLYPRVGKLVVNSYWDNYGNGDLSGYKFRYVIVPGNVKVSSNLNKLNFNETVNVLGVKP